MAESGRRGASKLRLAGVGKKLMTSESQWQLRVIAWVAAVSLAVPLSMFTTWVTISRYPVPDRDSINLGLFLFFLMVFLDIYLVCDLIVADLSNGKPISFLGLTSIFAVGLLVAVGLGILPWSIDWLWRRLIAAMPWVREIPWNKLLVLWFVAYVLWKKRKSAVVIPRHSWKSLAFLGGSLILLFTSTLLDAAYRFSGGKTSLGALYLTLAIAFGLLAVDVSVEIWKIWSRSRSANPAAPADQKASPSGR